MYGIYNNRRGRRPLCMVFITTDVPSSLMSTDGVPLMYGIYNNRRASSLMYGIYNNRRAVVPYVWYL